MNELQRTDMSFETLNTNGSVLPAAFPQTQLWMLAPSDNRGGEINGPCFCWTERKLYF